MDLYPRLLADVLKRSRNEALTGLLFGTLNIPLLIFVLRFHGVMLVIFVTVTALLLLNALRRTWQLRNGSPRIAALREPEKLVKIQSWPYVKKFPAKHVPMFVRIDTPDGPIRLKIGTADVKRFVDELAKLAPQLDVDVPNILVRPAAQ
jgi:hypothetical protein